MRTTPALRTLVAALFTGGVLTVVAAGTSAAAVPPTQTTTGGHGHHDPIWGTVVSRGELNLREQPTTNSAVVGVLSPGSQDRVRCAVLGQSVFGNPYWYWLVGAQAWASAAFVDTGNQGVPSCDPCPGWKDDSWKNDSWHDGSRNDSWSSSSSGAWSFSASGTWSWSAAGASSSSWGMVPGGG
ncbi:SH3 domain-containing protein [Streptomyces sp. SAS_270]|uniref:SH3 domain-containing protein n=1 Tax=Streptomyces sp. SAS_270 TaxID=3412748 RepID=UPI00403D41FE